MPNYSDAVTCVSLTIVLNSGAPNALSRQIRQHQIRQVEPREQGGFNVFGEDDKADSDSGQRANNPTSGTALKLVRPSNEGHFQYTDNAR